MVKIVGLYRWVEAASFNAEYYQREHFELTQKLLQPLGLKRLELTVVASDKRQAGDVVAISNAYFDSISEAIHAGRSAGEKLAADLHWYTNISPETQLMTMVAAEMA
jgi:uncharacterized protein (TIGR02118 family)